MQAFLDEAEAADREIDAGGAVHTSAEVHAWLGALVRGEKLPRLAALRRVDGQ